MLFQVLSIDGLGELSFSSGCNCTWTKNHLVHKRKLSHCLKSKEEKKLYLSLFKIAADILK